MATPSSQDWIRIGERLGVHKMDVEAKDWVEGCQHELEHWKTVKGNPLMIAGIALDHLRENPKYYQILKKIEQI